MPPAIIGGVIAGAGAIGSAVIGSNAAKSAANSSAAAADRAAAEQRAAREQALTTMQPFIQSGTAAGNQINALLGLGGTTTTGQPAGTVDWGSYVRGNPDALANWNAIQNTSDGARFGGDINSFGAFHYNSDGATRDLTPYTSQAVNGGNAQAAANQAFDNFRNSTGYQFRLNQGMNALNSGYAGAGTIKSGAAIKGALNYGQGLASQEFGNYLNALGNQQGVGLQAGSAANGVSQNVANSLGTIYQQNGANQANASLARASALGTGLSSLANLGGSILAGNGGNNGFNVNAANNMVANNLSYLNGRFGG